MVFLMLGKEISQTRRLKNLASNSGREAKAGRYRLFYPQICAYLNW